METKVCTKCGEEKFATSEFFHKDASRPDGRSPYCKDCVRVKSLSYRSRNRDAISRRQRLRYASADPKARSAKQKAYYDENRERLLEQKKAYHADNRDRIVGYLREYYAKNKDTLKRKSLERSQDPSVKRRRNRTSLARHQDRRSTDFAYNLTRRARSQANQALRGGSNSPGFFRHMPYTKDEFVAHLVSTLPEGYTEADICDGSKLHIDHIRPVSSFNLTGEIDDEFLKCWALENLQLLPAAENIAKGNRLDWNKE